MTYNVHTYIVQVHFTLVQTTILFLNESVILSLKTSRTGKINGRLANVKLIIIFFLKTGNSKKLIINYLMTWLDKVTSKNLI